MGQTLHIILHLDLNSKISFEENVAHYAIAILYGVDPLDYPSRKGNKGRVPRIRNIHCAIRARAKSKEDTSRRGAQLKLFKLAIGIMLGIDPRDSATLQFWAKMKHKLH